MPTMLRIRANRSPGGTSVVMWKSVFIKLARPPPARFCVKLNGADWIRRRLPLDDAWQQSENTDDCGQMGIRASLTFSESQQSPHATCCCRCLCPVHSICRQCVANDLYALKVGSRHKWTVAGASLHAWKSLQHKSEKKRQKVRE
jgi:hypothetical protein